MKGNRPEGVTASTLADLFDGAGNHIHGAAVKVTCLGYCEYYRGDEGEEGCCGLAAVKRGISAGKIAPAQLSHLLDVPPGPARRSGCLINEMCARCGYLDGGCDFMAPSPPAGATPCGGYRLIQALLDSGVLTPDVVRMLVEDAERRTWNVE